VLGLRISRKLIRDLKFGAIIILIIIAELSLPLKTISAELQRTLYYGDERANAVIQYLSFSDVSEGNWASEAIYETSALGFLTGFKDPGGRFGRTVPLTKAEALAVAYRAAGRGAEAQQLGTAINNTRLPADRKTDSLEVWYDGFLQLAASEGLISLMDLADAFDMDQAALPEDSFRRNSPAQRQEMAYWLCLTLNIAPTAQLQEVLNYTDWRSVDPDKLPYVEALLRYGIISGSNNRINPRQPVTREQCAQIIKNSEDFALQATGHSRISGIIEEMSPTSDYTDRTSSTGKNIYVTNADGSFALIRTSTQTVAPAGGRNENVGTALPGQEIELVVYKNGSIGNSSLLQEGDRIRYITDSSNRIKYVQVLSNVNDVRYLAANIQAVDQANRLIDVIQLFETDYPDLEDITESDEFSWSQATKATYRVSPQVRVTINGAKADLSQLTADAIVILTIDGNNLVKEIQAVDIGINAEARRIVRGIVEENNPNLGYITLYNEDGSGTGDSSLALRTYNYIDRNKIEVLKNHEPADIDSVKAGDTAYLRLDSDGYIVSVSAVDNYTVRYAKVLSRLPAQVIVEYDDGTQQILDVDEGIIVIKDKNLAGYAALRDGDRVRLLLSETPRLTELKEITIEGDEYYVNNIYKGKIARIDRISDKITVMGMQVFRKGRWELVDRKGATSIPLADSYRIYLKDTPISINEASKLLYQNDAYIAVGKTYGGIEKVVAVTYRNSLDKEISAVTDTISEFVPGSSSFRIINENKKIGFSDGSIIVKYGRLVTGNSLSYNDKVHLAYSRDYATGNYYASVVNVEEPPIDTFMIYRGRISDINQSRDFTIESFSQMQGLEWKYYNTPKTFNITLDTRILTEEGILNAREFVGYGEDSYKNDIVYVVADGVDAVLVSTAPYGIVNIRGTVYAAEDGTISLRKVSAYEPSGHKWENIADTTVNILNNTIAIENGAIIDPSSIERGTDVRIIKRDKSTGGDVYIIIVE
jgi:hypothetical protein